MLQVTYADRIKRISFSKLLGQDVAAMRSSSIWIHALNVHYCEIEIWQSMSYRVDILISWGMQWTLPGWLYWFFVRFLSSVKWRSANTSLSIGGLGLMRFCLFISQTMLWFFTLLLFCLSIFDQNNEYKRALWHVKIKIPWGWGSLLYLQAILSELSTCALFATWYNYEKPPFTHPVCLEINPVMNQEVLDTSTPAFNQAFCIVPLACWPITVYFVLQ